MISYKKNTKTNANSLRHTKYKRIVVITWNKTYIILQKKRFYIYKDEFLEHIKEIQYWKVMTLMIKTQNRITRTEYFGGAIYQMREFIPKIL